MSKSKMTPGPWVRLSKRVMAKGGLIYIDGVMKRRVCDEQAASAQAIAALPELINELKHACQYFRASYIVTEESKDEPEYQMWQGFEAALKKAGIE